VIKCQACEVSLNKHSRISNKEETDEVVWKCEFCFSENILPNGFTIHQVPTQEEMTYCLTVPEEATAADGEESKGLQPPVEVQDE
jgi:hypothetical protein